MGWYAESVQPKTTGVGAVTVVGTPLIIFVAVSNCRPAGRVPLATAHLIGSVPPPHGVAPRKEVGGTATPKAEPTTASCTSTRLDEKRDALIASVRLADLDGSATDVAVIVTDPLGSSLGFEGAARKAFCAPLALVVCAMEPQAAQLVVHVTSELPLPPLT